MLSSKISAQPPVFIAFFPFITIPTAKSGFKNEFPHGLEATKPLKKG